MVILDGKTTSAKIRAEIKDEIDQIVKKYNVKPPRLDIILVGDDFASKKYIQYKEIACKEVGIESVLHQLDTNCSLADILNLENNLNNSNSVSGYYVQLPLPKCINEFEVLESINPQKDIDGLTSTNLGLLFKKNPIAVCPATALAIVNLLTEYGISLYGKEVLIIGASDIVGLPTGALMIQKGATITFANSKTVNTAELAYNSEIVVSAVGKPKLVKADWIKEGTVVVDVGVSQDPQTGKAVGDVDYDNVADKTSYISKVIGGVGPMTIACLLKNTLDVWKRSLKIS